MGNLHVVLGDQLTHSISGLQGYNSDKDIVLMCEVWEEAKYVKHHKKKLAFVFSAMRHFAKELVDLGFQVEYVKLDDPGNTGSIHTEVERILLRYNFGRIIVTHPGEYRVLAAINLWSAKFNLPVDVLPDNRFLCSPQEFAAWAQDKQQLRMEYFYRMLRKKYNILMQGSKPEGGKWNYDEVNRSPPTANMTIPKPYTATIDSITAEVIAMVARKFPEHFGELEPFYFAVTRYGALQVLEQFIQERLPLFGCYQDAMLTGEPWLYHSHLGFYLNCGLLLPIDCIQAAEQAYKVKQAPLNSVEGFIRQILGWREYVRGIYWLTCPDYADKNFLQANRQLPNFYWDANTKMNCLHQVISETKVNAYAHHIQRLMVLGNFALLAGIAPKYVNDWFLSVYADAYEWVELPNVSGMILFADGGYLATKPYAAGGSYINKMSDYCSKCFYNVKLKTGKNSCPFNYLYWGFLGRNRDKLISNPRLAMMYSLLDKMEQNKRQNIYNDSKSFLVKLDAGELV